MLIEKSMEEYAQLLGSSSSTPGGGSAAAYAGALAASLGLMVAYCTEGKKAYAQHQEVIVKCIARLKKAQCELNQLVDEDARAFEPLARAFRIPRDDPGREAALEDASKLACRVPLRSLEIVDDILDDLEMLAEKGSRMVISDVACSASFVCTVIQCALINIDINKGAIRDESFKQDVIGPAYVQAEESTVRAQHIYKDIKTLLSKV